MPHEEKRAARAVARSARRAVPASERARAGEAVAHALTGLPELAGVRTALAYASTAEEIDAAAAVRALRARGVRVAFPRVCGPGLMTLHLVEPDEELSEGYCGILEPDADAEQVRPDELDLVLVPAAAFDERCCRLGMGGGFYDRLLPDLPLGTLTVGLAYEEQIVDALPQEPHDVRVSVVITPSRVRRRD